MKNNISAIALVAALTAICGCGMSPIQQGGVGLQLKLDVPVWAFWMR